MRGIDLTGQKFNRLTALARDPRKRQHWFFRCDCGVEKSQFAPGVTRGDTKSCGCLNTERLTEPRKHGHARKGQRHPLYSLWAGMIARCQNPNHNAFANYGGRGIKVCARWLSFENFVADMGERPEGTTLDRKDTDGDYEPDNCRWATPAEQSENTRRNVYLELNGERMTVSQWAQRLGVDQRTLNRRRYLGWTDEEVLTTPVGS